MRILGRKVFERLVVCSLVRLDLDMPHLLPSADDGLAVVEAHFDVLVVLSRLCRCGSSASDGGFGDDFVGTFAGEDVLF